MSRDRREFSAKVMVAAFKRCKGRCESCGVRLSAGRINYDHVIPDAMGGQPLLENCAVLCAACHGVKTRTLDVPAIAKVKRIQAKHIGAKRSAWPTSKWRRKVNGETVPREAKP